MSDSIDHGSDGSNNFVEKAPSSFSKKKSNTMSQTEDELCRVICINQKKAADVLPRSEGDNCYDLDEQFGKDSCYDEDDCMWLSSDISFRSSFSSHQSLEEWFVSWLLISESSYLIGGRGITFFDGSIINPIEEASLALENSIQDAEKIFPEEKEEDVLTWLLSSTGNDAVTPPVSSSVTCIGSPESSYLQTSEDLTSSEMSTSLSTHLDSPSRKLDLDKPGFWVSLLNLEGEDSKWISDTESELDSFQSDFRSPSFNSRCCSEGLSSRSSVSSFTELRHKTSEYDPSSEHVSNGVELGNINSDGPLFWPFEWKFDWSSSDCFSMSPSKDIGKLGSPLKTPPKFHGLGKVNTKEGCNRRLVFSSTPTTTKILEHKHKNDKKCVKRVETTTSRLRKSGKACMKIVPLDMNYDIIKAKGENVAKERLACADPNFLEGDFASHEELQIELLMGLGEFDGHEGVDLEFDKDDFFLDESL